MWCPRARLGGLVSGARTPQKPFANPPLLLSRPLPVRSRFVTHVSLLQLTPSFVALTCLPILLVCLPQDEMLRGRHEQQYDEEERAERNLLVQRRHADLQHEASQLISQSEMRIHRIGKVRGFSDFHTQCDLVNSITDMSSICADGRET